MNFIKMLFSKEMIRSFIFFLKLIFKKRKYDIIFVNSVVFNRNNGQNNLFKPFIELCEKWNLKYLILEDADLKGEYKQFKRNNKTVPYDFFQLITLILRKVYAKKIKTLDKYETDLFIAKKLKHFLNIDADIYITLIWNKVTLWRLLSPDAKIIDYQHGVTLNGHKGYLYNGKPPKIKTRNKIITLTYSKLISDLLINNDTTGYYTRKNVLPIGVYNEKQKLLNDSSNQILFTLQITPDFDTETNNKYIRILNRVLAELKTTKYDVVMKHHPRYNKESVHNKINGMNFSIIDTYELLKKTKIHFTFHSSSAIDAALLGVPTIFINQLDEMSPVFYDQQFKYPFNNFIISDVEDIPEIITFIENNYEAVSNRVYKWGKELNNDFDAQTLKKIVYES